MYQCTGLFTKQDKVIAYKLTDGKSIITDIVNTIELVKQGSISNLRIVNESEIRGKGVNLGKLDSLDICSFAPDTSYDKQYMVIESLVDCNTSDLIGFSVLSSLGDIEKLSLTKIISLASQGKLVNACLQYNEPQQIKQLIYNEPIEELANKHFTKSRDYLDLDKSRFTEFKSDLRIDDTFNWLYVNYVDKNTLRTIKDEFTCKGIIVRAAKISKPAIVYTDDNINSITVSAGDYIVYLPSGHLQIIKSAEAPRYLGLVKTNQADTDKYLRILKSYSIEFIGRADKKVIQVHNILKWRPLMICRELRT